MSKINEILQRLFALQHGNMNHGLQRIELLLEKLNAPQKNYPIIHIAGSNGKGSVCCFIASILQANGLKVGLYTSPHILNFNERIRVNGVKITEEEIVKSFELLEETASEINASFFEITTAIAFEHFRNSTVDIAVIEVGLGGRFDSTNVIDNPLLSVITSISKDHCEILGDTIEKITHEKAGIIKKNCPVLVQDTNANVLSIFQKKCQEMSSQLFFAYQFPSVELEGYSENLRMILDCKIPLEAFTYNRINAPNRVNVYNQIDALITSNLIGLHQITNIRTAIFAALLVSSSFGTSSKFHINSEAIIDGISNVRQNTGLKYRMECVNKNPYIILDVAHNPQSIELLVNTLTDATMVKEWNFIFGVMRDKDIEQMLKFIKPICKKFMIVVPDIERAADAALISGIAKSLDFDDIVSEASVASALKTIKAHNETKDSNAHTVICGSFYVIEQAVRALGIEDE